MSDTNWTSLSNHSSYSNTDIIKQNPLFDDDDLHTKLITATTKPPTLLLAWNPKFVHKIDIKGVHISISSLDAVRDTDLDRSLRSFSLSPFETQTSRSSSEIDEDLFDMSQIPALPEPKLTSHPLSIVPEKMIKDLSVRLASSRERTLLTTTMAKSEKFGGSSDFGSLPGSSRFADGSTVMFPILHELDLMLANSRTLNTFKVKVHQAKERLESGYEGKVLLAPQQTATEPTSKPTGRLKRFYNRKRRLFQALTALLLIILFLAMLVSLSICCSNRADST